MQSIKYGVTDRVYQNNYGDHMVHIIGHKIPGNYISEKPNDIIPPPISYEWPPAAMTWNSTTFSGLSYGNGTYTLTGSGQIGGDAGTLNYGYWLAFNKVVPPDLDQYIAGETYNFDGTYPASGSSITSISGVEIKGAYVTLQLPIAVTLTSYTLTSLSRSSSDFWRRTPRSWIIAGSNDGSTWMQVDTRTDITYTGYNQTPAPFIVKSTTSYVYYRIVVTSIHPASDGFLCIGELRYFGY